MAERRRRAHEASKQPIVTNLRWEVASQLPTLFANQVFIHLQEGYLLMTFGLTELPYAAVTAEERERVRNEGMTVTLVARVAMGAHRLGEVIRALTQVYEASQQPRFQQPGQQTGGQEPK